MKKILTILFLIVTLITTAQVAIIDDKDGYTNVRLKPNSKSEIIYKLKSNQVFWYAQEDYYSENSEWIWVDISKNHFSIVSGSLDNLQGYVHRSRIKPLNKVAKYTGTNVIFKYDTKPFSEENKIIDYQSNWIIAINGFHPWGTDGGKPKTEVDKLIIKIGKKNIEVPKVLISDIYECSNNFSIYKIEQTFFVHQRNSDGAGSYEIVWVFSEKGIQQRLVGNNI